MVFLTDNFKAFAYKSHLILSQGHQHIHGFKCPPLSACNRIDTKFLTTCLSDLMR